MTKRRLKQFRKLQKEIVVLQCELDSLRDRAETESRIYGVYSLTDDPAKEIQRRAAELDARRAAFTKRLHEIEEFIEQIDDSTTRTVFRLRYFEGWGWLRIAFQIGYTDEQRPRKLHDGYLQSQAVDKTGEFCARS